MSAQGVDDELYREFKAIAEGAGCQLLHVKFASNQLQVFLEHEDGVTVEHCRTVSKQISAFLDIHEFGNQRYILEVSSPGLDRELYETSDYERFRDHLARVTFTNEEGKKQTIVGRLRGLITDDHGNSSAEVEVEASSPSTKHSIPLDAIRIARLEVEF